MAPFRSLILLAVCFAVPGDRPRVSWDQIYERALAELSRGNFEAARGSAEAGYRAWRGAPNSEWNWRFRLAMADALIGMDRVAEVKALLEPGAPCSEAEAHRQLDLAYVHFRTHDFDGARRSLDTAEALAPDAPAELLGRLHLIRGMVYLTMERPKDAEASFHRALDAVAGSHSLLESYAITDLGFLNLRQFRYDEAVTWFERARKLAEETGASRALTLAVGNLGESYLRLGDYEQALRFLEQAVALAGKSGDRLYQISYLHVIGELYQHLQKDGEAVRYHEKALALVRPEDGGEFLIDIQDDLAELALARGDIAGAERFNEEAKAVAKRVPTPRAQVRPNLQAAGILRARHRYPAAEARYREAVAISAKVKDPISLWESYSGLASLYTEAGRIAEAGRNYRLAISTIETERLRLRKEQSKFTFLAHLIRFYREYVDFLVDRGDAAGAFRVVESCRARVLAEKLHGEGFAAYTVDPEALAREARESGTIFLSYWLAPKRSFLWVIDGSGLHQFALPKEAEITANIERYTSAILRGRDPLAGDRAAGRWLFANLINAHYAVAPGASVVIVPDGSLHQLNFESLPDREGSRYWISEVTVTLAPSLAVLGRAPGARAERLLLIGDPALEGTGFTHLPNLRSEMDAVSRRFAAREVYTGAAASPAVYRQAELERYSVLHFATHAVANRANPLDSSIILSGPEGSRKLYARDVLAHPLRAELVTLSACQTAGNRAYYGEGLTGLTWAFLSAGARNVVAGLWEVDDRATAQLMEAFYRALTPGRVPASALRQAKLSLISSEGAYRKPLYWAAFETFSRTLYTASPGYTAPPGALASATVGFRTAATAGRLLPTQRAVRGAH